MHFPVFLSFFSAVFPAVTGQAQCGEQMGVGRGKGRGFSVQMKLVMETQTSCAFARQPEVSVSFYVSQMRLGSGQIIVSWFGFS